MLCIRILLSFIAVISSSRITFAKEDLLRSFQNEIEPILDRYCYDCHGYGMKEGGVVFDEFDEGKDIHNHELWLKVLKNTRASVMPPDDEPKPSDLELKKIAGWVKSKAFKIDPEFPDPGHITVKRLNRIEYRNTIRDLMGIDFDAMDAFPPDDSGEGFDNIGEALSISPLLLEKYLDAAHAIVAEAVPTQPRVVAEERIVGKDFIVSRGELPEVESKRRKSIDFSFYNSQIANIDYAFRNSGSYQIFVDAEVEDESEDDLVDLSRCRLILKIDGQTLFEKEFDRSMRKLAPLLINKGIEKGGREIAIQIEPLTPDVEQIGDLRVRLEHITIKGPLESEYWVHPKEYDRFFLEDPPASKKDRRSYTKRVLREFATRAFRRPQDEATVNRLSKIADYYSTQEGRTIEFGLAQAMVAILASPRFIFREEGTERLRSSEKYPDVDDYALATRLSYFLWSSMPDEELFKLAKANRLRENLETQVTRMLKDQRSQQFVENFVGQWLHARDVADGNINGLDVFLRDHYDPEVFEARKTFSALRLVPAAQRTEEQKAAYAASRAIVAKVSKQPRPRFLRSTREAMRKETEMAFEYVLKNNRSLLELLDSDYTFLNEDLAEHYGMEGISGSRMRLVKLAEDSPRGGILTQGTILTTTSNPNRTSPVKRGLFVMENILGLPSAPPPPDIPALEEAASEEELSKLSLRETLALHREKPLCSSCHNRMDPLGLALENFNALGIWRDAEMGHAIDPSGRLMSGESFENIQDLKRILATKRKADFYYCISEKLLTYALGRGLEYYDVETLDRLVETLEETGGQPQALVLAIAQSTPFQKTRHKALN